MNFEALTIQAVKSISQRRLLGHWSELAAGNRFPAFADFHVDERMHDPKQLMIWSIERESGRRRFRAQFHGPRVSEVFRNDWVGRTMDEAVPERFRQFALDTAEECAGSGCAIFSIISTVDGEGQRVDCERLLLPFGNDDRVEQIVSSLQLISLKGNFRRSTVLDNYQTVSTVELAGRIAAGFEKPASARAVIEVVTPGAR